MIFVDNSIFNVDHILSPEYGTRLVVKKGLDIEDQPTYFVQIRASSIDQEIEVAPKNPASLMNVTVVLVDINNHPPVFQKKLWAVGLSEKDEPNKVAIIKLNVSTFFGFYCKKKQEVSRRAMLTK